MVKKIKQLFCDHRKVVHYRTDLVRQDDGSLKTVHKWKCKKCGKVIRNDNI
jgi:RNase P subunit RPR2